MSFEDIADYITVTGNLDEAQVARCMDYVDQHWPDTGQMLLKYFLESNHSNTPLFKTGHIEKPLLGGTWSMSWENSEDKRSVRVLGPESFILDIADQLAWLISTFSPGFSRAELCSTSVAPSYTTEDGTLLIRMTVSCRPEKGAKQFGGCWVPMLRGAKLVQGFPVASRTFPSGSNISVNTKGVEVDFDLLKELAGIEAVFEFQNSVVLKGYTTVLFPVARYDNAIQWHLKARTNYEPYLPIQVARELRRFTEKGLTVEQNIEWQNVRMMRHFVGWCPSAQIHLGTRDACYGTA